MIRSTGDELRRQLPPPLASLFAELEADTLELVGPRDEIARRNAWSYAPADDERRTLTIAQLATFLDAVASLWADRVAIAAAGPWVFYAWHDAQVGALCLSLVPGRRGDPLPFGATVALLDDPALVCAAFLRGSDVIPWSELANVDDALAPDTDGPFVVQVFARELSRTPGADAATARPDADDPALTAAFERAVREALARQASFGDLVQLLRAYKDRGLSRAEANRALESVRGDVGEPDDDRVLEVLDIVTGWCAPHNRVW